MLATIKKIWMRLLLRKAHYQDACNKMEQLYLVHDPWNMASEREQYRLKETARVIKEEMGAVKTLLEIGSGEGHQSLFFKDVTDKLYGIDISEKAVARAAKNCPDATFEVGDINSYQPPNGQKYDLVVACEILYYLSDIAKAIDKLNGLGKKCLVSYFKAEFKNLDPFFNGIKNSRSRIISYGALSWKIVWWESQKG
ncbi:MAG: class I SAM-dependent methyltransferase [Deltaproteobacteria bacterium]|nr:class I SAM-dependent methyltransferase [Deltaproteobacteria bacterium]